MVIRIKRYGLISGQLHGSILDELNNLLLNVTVDNGYTIPSFAESVKNDFRAVEPI